MEESGLRKASSANAGSAIASSAFASSTFEKGMSFELDKPVGSMSISPCGRDVVLASRQGLHIIDLDSPWAPPRHLPHHTPWEVADVQWSPFASRDYWVVSTSNQRALVWNLAMSTPNASIEHYLHAHSRAITDINFSAHHPDVLGTCAVDSFVHCWDLRHPARPVMSFSDWFAGATQVKWSRQDPHVIASSHNKFLQIWDDRKGAYPLKTIEAHATKIYGLDWNRTKATSVATCSLDKTIKFWDYASESDIPERVIETPFPVWRARHTPFGSGLLAMPQRGDNNLYLYDRRQESTSEWNGSVAPTKRFEGHGDQVKEFLWRARGTVENKIDNREFQLVSWGADRILRLHKMDDTILDSVGYQKGREIQAKLNFTRKNAAYKTFRDEPTKYNKDGSTGGATSSHGYIEPSNGLNLQSLWTKEPMPSPFVSLGGWSHGDYLNTRHGMRTKAPSRKDINPISWMKGVKIGKKEAGLEQSVTSIASTNFRLDKTWEDFENLGEEISHVGQKFSKVNFYEVDVKSRYVKISMRGLWGLNEPFVYLDCRLDFPIGYPTEAIPSFKVEKTALLDDKTIARLKADVQTIAETYLEFQRSSLEALIRYLQGDQTLEDALAWTKDEQENSVIDFDGDAGSSSDDDDDLGKLNGSQIDDFGLAGPGLSSTSNANAKMPLPKACGAVWARNGTLVCFFPPKVERSMSSVGSLTFDGAGLLSGGKRKKIFGGFGKLCPPSMTRSKASSLGTHESSSSDSDSDYSSSETSSGDSSSSRGASGKGPSSTSRRVFDTEILNFPLSEGFLDDVPNSNDSVSMSRSAAASSKTFISIHNLEALLPAKRRLAERYELTGPNACANNATVALGEGYFDLADTWSLIDMILKKDIPLEEIRLQKKTSSQVVYRVFNALKNKEDDKSMSSDMGMKTKRAMARGHIKWSLHPFGRALLVQELFSYYGRLADTQMLGMMACVFARPVAPIVSRKSSVGSSPKTRRSPNLRFSQSTKFLPVDSSSSSNAYFPSLEVASSLLGTEESSSVGWHPVAKTTMDPSSLESSFGAPNSETQSAGLTPPYPFRPTPNISERTNFTESSMSSSPEQLRQTHRSNSNLAASFAASFSRPFSFSASASSSPPNPSMTKKRASPLSGYGGLQLQNVAWGTSSTVGKSLSSTDEPRSISATLDRRSDEKVRRRKAGGGSTRKSTKIKVTLKNQDRFLNDGYSDVPLLDPAEAWRYKAYRQAYAYLLTIWEMPLTKAEVLKFNSHESLPQDGNTRVPNSEDASLAIGKRMGHRNSTSTGHGALDLRVPCHVCSEPRPSDLDAGAKCAACNARAVPPSCVLCAELIRGRASPCLNCGHVLHASCLTLIQRSADVDLESGVMECITGCWCPCLAYSQVEVPWPLAGMDELLPHERQARKASSTPSTIREVDESMAQDESVHDAAWEDVAYVSLARNLAAAGAKVVTGRGRRASRGKGSGNGIGGTERGR